MKLKDDLAGIRIELVDLNTLAYFYVRKANRLQYLFQKTTRQFVLEEFTSLRYMENGLILHLTKLDDERANYSFQKILKKMNKISFDQKLLKSVSSRIKDYRKQVNYLKNSHRNSRIAHLNVLEYPSIDEFLIFEQSLKPLIIEANEIGDLLYGKKLGYEFKLGSLEGVIDFRKSLKDFKISYKGIEGFS